MQDYYGLECIFEELLKTVDYMNMTISIGEGHIVTLIYEKLMNLYLYIPPHSAHPQVVLTGLVYGNILCIQSLCRNEDDINRRMKEFYARLLVRGYHRDLLIPAFTKVVTGERAFIKRGSVQRCISDQYNYTKVRVFFHLTYHPRDPTSKYLQRQCRQHLLHPPWERPLWTLKNTKFPLVSNQCVWHMV